MSFFTLSWRVIKLALISITTVSVLGTALLFWSASLPQEPLRQHAKDGIEQGFFTENWPQYAYFRRIDMFTECAGINIALELRPQIERILAPQNFLECKALTSYITENTPPGSWLYARYWHGSQVLLKPLYTAYGVKEVRWLSVVLGLSLMTALFLAASARVGMAWGAALVLSYALPGTLTPFAIVTHGIQFWWVLLSSIAVFLWRSPQPPLTLFAFIGAGATFVCFFNMESLSLSMALLCYCLLRRAQGQQVRATLQDAFWLCAAWGSAFVGMWLVKWALAWLVLPQGADFFGKTLESYAPSSLDGIAMAIAENIRRTPWMLSLAILLALGWRFYRQGLRWATGLGALWLPALLPFFWYSLMPGHADQHSFFMTVILWPTAAVLIIVLLGDKAVPPSLVENRKTAPVES